MKVADLIYLLQAHPPNSVVVVPDRTTIRPLGTAEVQLIRVALRQDEVGVWLEQGNEAEGVLIGALQPELSRVPEYSFDATLPATDKLLPQQQNTGSSPL